MGQSAKYNWVAAFVAFCGGSTFDEISAMLAIPLELLHDRAAADKWNALRKELPLLDPVSLLASTLQGENTPFNAGQLTNGEQTLAVQANPTASLTPAMAEKFQALVENRKTNFQLADALRKDVLNIIKELNDGTLRMEQFFNSKAGVSTVSRKLNMGDRVNLATYLRLITEITYRALGDASAANERGAPDSKRGYVSSVPPITIVLPGIIAKPRAERGLEAERNQKTIDVLPESPFSPPSENASQSETPPADTPPAK